MLSLHLIVFAQLQDSTALERHRPLHCAGLCQLSCAEGKGGRLIFSVLAAMGWQLPLTILPLSPSIKTINPALDRVGC